jgi:16S rRNA (guanine527-N7)-methyltransferase
MELVTWLSECGVEVTKKQLKQFELYYDFLISKNQVMNLTTITDKDEVYHKHFIDSLFLMKVINFKKQKFLDVGSGAGFPSIPLKIIFPEIEVTIIDSLQKRITFLEELVRLLELDHVRLIHGRIEEFKEKESFDVVSARALARLNLLVEFCIPFVKTNGYFIAMKSLHYEEELKEAKKAIELLGGAMCEPYIYDLSNELTHVLIPIKKIHSSEIKYPRNFGSMKKRPL